MLVTRTRRASIVAALVAAAITAAGASAIAQAPPGPESGEEAVAQSLFEAGRDLMAEGKVDLACPKFEESNRISPSAGTLLNLGRCFELQGKTASAWVAYKKAVGLARAAGQTRHVTAGEKFIADVTPHLSRIRVEAIDPAPGLVVTRGGAALGAAALGVPLVVDPGVQSLEATAPGREAWSATVTALPDGGEVLVTIPALAPSRSPAIPPVPRAEGAQEKPPTESGTPTIRVAGFVASGVGLATLGVGIAFGAMTLSDASAAESDDALCPDKRCSPEGEAAIDSAETKAWVANIAIGVGAAAVVTGGILVAWSYLSPPSGSAGADRRAAFSHLGPWAGPDGAGIRIGGAL